MKATDDLMFLMGFSRVEENLTGPLPSKTLACGTLAY